METYGLRHCSPETCPKCGGRISQKTTMHRGVMMYRCGTEGCQRRISAESGGVLEGSHLSPAKFLDFLFYWAHDCAGFRAVEMLGLG